ncbi:MAG: glycosyltransferase family 9 protein, partial [Desulfobaccales bacterium]|nr:glycosyltransferase family 9 protein [Desulfobaccales bacterium]
MWHNLLMWLAKKYLRHKAFWRPPLALSWLEPDKIRRVLLISATGLGDTLFSTPAIRALKERFPSWSLEVLGHRQYGALLAHNPYVDKLWAYPGRNWRLVPLARQLRQREYDLVIILHGNDPEATMLAYRTGSPFIIGSAYSPFAFAYSGRVKAGDTYEHAIERRLNFVRLLGADTQDKKMDLFLPPEETTRTEALLAHHFGAPPPLLLALHPTGSDPYKWWPAKSFAALGNFLYEAYGAALLIISGRQDRQIAEDLAARMSGPTLVTGGSYSLLTTAALLNQCRLLVANDSGPLHMALALGVPSIALIGADDPRRIGPYGVEWGAYLHKREQVCDLDPCLT